MLLSRAKKRYPNQTCFAILTIDVLICPPFLWLFLGFCSRLLIASLSLLMNRANKNERKANASRLYEFVERYWPNQTRVSQVSVLRKLENELWKYLASPEISECLASIEGFLCLIRISNEAYTDRVIRTSNVLRVLLSGRRATFDNVEVIEATVEFLAKFANERGPDVLRFRRTCLNDAIEAILCDAEELVNAPSLSARDEAKILRNILIIKSLSTLVYDLIYDSLEEIFTALCLLIEKSESKIQDYCIAALSTIFSVCSDCHDGQKAEDLSKRALGKAHEFIRSTLERNDAEGVVAQVKTTRAIAGAIFTIQAVISSTSFEIYQDRNTVLVSMASLALSFRKSTESDIVHALRSTLPVIAAIASAQQLHKDCITECCDYFFMIARHKKLPCSLRQEAVIALGEIARDVGSLDFTQYLPRALELARDLFQISSADGERALEFVTRIAQATKVNDDCFADRMRTCLLAYMFREPFSDSLVDALKAVISKIPDLDNRVQNNIVRKAARVLAKNLPGPAMWSTTTRGSEMSTHCESGYSLGKELFRDKVSALSLNGYVSVMAQAFEYDRITCGDQKLSKNMREKAGEPQVELGMEASSIALQTLAKFQFTVLRASRLAWFANEFVVGYVESTSPVIRRRAIHACVNLMHCAAIDASKEKSMSGRQQYLRRDIFMIISQIVSLAVVDPSPDVRLVALRSLNEEVFYPYLAQPEVLPHISLCLHDEDMEIRIEALALTCRVGRLNSAQVHPYLRQFTKHLLTVIHCPWESFTGIRSQATGLLQLLIHNDLAFAQLFATTIADALLDCLKMQLLVLPKADISAALPVLQAIGDFAGGPSVDLRPHAKIIMPLLIEIVLDFGTSDVEFRKAALRALARVIQNTGHEIKPYDCDSRLMLSLVSLLKSESDDVVRIQTLELLGVIGAVNPDREDFKYATLPFLTPTGRNKGDATLGNEQDDRAVVRQGYSSFGSAGAFSGTTYGGGIFGGGNVIPSNRGPNNVFGRGSVARQKPLSEVHIAKNCESETAKPPLFGNASLGCDFIWVANEMGKEKPVWAWNSLKTPSLVARLEHPFTSDDNYFPSAVLDVLHKIVSNSRYAPQHLDVVMAIVRLASVIKNAECCKMFLPTIVPRLLWMLRPISRERRVIFTEYQENLFLQLAELVKVVKADYAEFQPATISLCLEYLTDKDQECRRRSVVPITNLLNCLRIEIGNGFRPFAVFLIEPMINSMLKDRCVQGENAKSIILTFKTFGRLLEQYLCVVIPSLIAVIEDQNSCIEARTEAMIALTTLLKECTSRCDLLSCIVHPLVRVLADCSVSHHSATSRGVVLRSAFKDCGSTPLSVRASCDARYKRSSNVGNREKVAQQAVVALCEIASQFPSQFIVFIPTVAKALLSSGLDRKLSKCKKLEQKLFLGNEEGAKFVLGDRSSDNGSLCDEEESNESGNADPRKASIVASSTNVAKAYEPNASVLIDRVEVHNGLTAQDWNNWIDNLASALFSQSQSASIRSVAVLGDRYPRFTRELFNAAFLSCWTPLLLEPQRRIVAAFHEALSSPTLPLNVKQMLLDLIEFMDHDERPLPLSYHLLAKAAVDVGAYAKAVRHTETIYRFATNVDELKQAMSGSSGLIGIYNHLGHTVSAYGTIEHFREVASPEQARSVAHEFSETVNLLPKTLSDYENVLSFLPQDIDLSTVNSESEHRGKLVFTEEVDIAAVETSRRVVLKTNSNLDRSRHGQSSAEEQEPNSDQGRYRDLKWFLTLSQLRCLNGLGEWRKMEKFVEKSWEEVGENRIARTCLATDGKAASVAFDLSRWDKFRERVHAIPELTFDGHFYRSLLHIFDGKNDSSKLKFAEDHISSARKMLDAGLTTRASEGYPRAYLDFLNAQHLVEMEEMITYLRCSSSDPVLGQIRLQGEWDARLKEVKPDYHTWYRLLMIRALVLDKKKSKDHWLKFATKCRKDNRLPMATEALRMLVLNLAEVDARDSDPKCSDLQTPLASTGGELPPVEKWDTSMIRRIPDLSVRFACIKHLWALKRKKDAFCLLDECVECNPRQDQIENTLNSPGRIGLSFPSSESGDADGRLKAEIHLKLAKWSARLASSNTNVVRAKECNALEYAGMATQCSPTWYKPWHFWAILNDDEAQKQLQTLDKAFQDRETGVFESQNSRSDRRRRRITYDPARHGPEREWKEYLMNAIEGYFQAIKFGGKTTLEDALTLLTLWFDFGGDFELGLVFKRGFELSAPDRWLDVVPQIIARLYVPHVQDAIKNLLARIGKYHPHVAVFPLTVAMSSPGQGNHQETRRRLARDILSEIQKTHDTIVHESALVAGELNRVAILSHEFWYDRIEEASKLYYGENKVERMIECLRPLHDALRDKPPETEMEVEFKAEHGVDLDNADRKCKEWLRITQAAKRNGALTLSDQQHCQRLMDEAWISYFQVFRRIQKKQSSLVQLRLKSVSPELHKCQGLALAVPGTYKSRDGDAIRIESFKHDLDVLQSKQRPRRLAIYGSDGYLYSFLLKGHDDLRQDERVMQVFGLINQHLAQSEERSVRQGAELKRYAVVAVSSNAGLIEWVPDCDTMHSLVKEFRENRKIMPNIEHKVMSRVAPEPDKLPLLHKVGLFDFMLSNTGGRDINRVLWLKSRNSEMWLDRRTNFARTLATTSIAGYILGLGDRHPSNIMIERSSGRVMHIDFGDCFEVAMRREKYPETVPFRLTRMLVQALEPCLVHGHFRHMAVAMMKVLRQSNTSAALHAMMEAFIHDPLIRQKLLDGRDMDAVDEAGHEGRPDQGSYAPQSRLAARYNEVGSLHEVAMQENGNVPDVSDPILRLSENPSQHNRVLQNRTMRDGNMSGQLAVKVENLAMKAIDRVLDKLSGHDFDEDGPLTEEVQVDKLIEQARSVENLCQLFPGWVAPW